MKSKPRGKPVTTLRVHVIQLIEQRIDGLTQQAGHDFRPLMEHFFFFFFSFLDLSLVAMNIHSNKFYLYCMEPNTNISIIIGTKKKKKEEKKKKKTNFEDFFSPLFF